MDMNSKNIKTLNDNLDAIFDRAWKEECMYTEPQEKECDEYDSYDYYEHYDYDEI